MNLSPKAQDLYDQISTTSTKLGDLKKMAKLIKKDHDLALELWSTAEYLPRMLATLILDKKLLTQALIDEFTEGMQSQSDDEQSRIMEWLMANQLMKDKKTMALMLSWENSPSPLQRRTFWYYQARLRWTGQTGHDNTPALLSKIESDLASEAPAVQWAMNFTAAWIGIYDSQHRERIITLGEATGLYKEEVPVKGCTPNYLPAFIETELAKGKGK